MDRLLTYPHLNNLSACEQPIRVVHRPAMHSARTTPSTRSLTSHPPSLLTQRQTIAQHSSQQTISAINEEAGAPHGVPRPLPSPNGYESCPYRMTARARATASSTAAPTHQARAFLTAMTPAPSPARRTPTATRADASLPVRASPDEGVGVPGTGVSGALGVTTAGV